MIHIEFSSPAPSCLVPLTHPAQGRNMHETDVSKTWDEHSIGDDYDDVERTAYLDMIGEFK